MLKLHEVEDPSEAGRRFHTALRKLCDSTPTSILYNAWAVVSSETCMEYCEALASVLNEEYENREELAKACRDQFLNVDYIGHREKSLLHCSAIACDLDDWMGATSFFVNVNN